VDKTASPAARRIIKILKTLSPEKRRVLVDRLKEAPTVKIPQNRTHSNATIQALQDAKHTINPTTPADIDDILNLRTLQDVYPSIYSVRARELATDPTSQTRELLRSLVADKSRGAQRGPRETRRARQELRDTLRGDHARAVFSDNLNIEHRDLLGSDEVRTLIDPTVADRLAQMNGARITKAPSMAPVPYDRALQAIAGRSAIGRDILRTPGTGNSPLTAFLLQRPEGEGLRRLGKGLESVNTKIADIRNRMPINMTVPHATADHQLSQVPLTKPFYRLLPAEVRHLPADTPKSMVDPKNTMWKGVTAFEAMTPHRMDDGFYSGYGPVSMTYTHAERKPRGWLYKVIRSRLSPDQNKGIVYTPHIMTTDEGVRGQVAQRVSAGAAPQVHVHKERPGWDTLPEYEAIMSRPDHRALKLYGVQNVDGTTTVHGFKDRAAVRRILDTLTRQVDTTAQHKAELDQLVQQRAALAQQREPAIRSLLGDGTLMGYFDNSPFGAYARKHRIP
jgi:hypothetical protein